MRSSVISGCAAALISVGAQAQSSVTLYGVADDGLVYANNAAGHAQFQMNSGNIMGSRWGLRGTEDLGGGLAALFVLENGFSVANGKFGQGNDEFGRQAYAGLASTQLGSLTLGRQYDSVVDYTGPFESGTQWATSFGAHPGDLDNMNNSNRVNNAIKYASASFGGLSFGGVYGVGGVAGAFHRNQVWSLGARYAAGALTVGAAYLNVSDPNYGFFGNNASSSATASNMTSRVYSGYASAGKQQVISAGAAYAIGGSTLGFTYSNTQFKDLGSEAVSGVPAAEGSARFHNVEVNYKIQITAALLLGAAYDFTSGYGVNHAHYHQAVAGLDYFLSKRTDVYLTGIYQHASGTDSTGNRAVANINLLSPSSTPSQVAAIAGLRVRF
ncbi:porin [Caballeronia sp. LZ034LL]|uniref:porin n=1 Tax=Caballeronia sp. LZ034LL TaxID=3038567 RepID=UPI002859B3CE|nr:porin [Caballeronia sp. LZ034LL]MDR5836519.1 porin [Caballeronia sp. LZ034LL]